MTHDKPPPKGPGMEAANTEFILAVRRGEVRMIGDEANPHILWDWRWHDRVIRAIMIGDWLWLYIEHPSVDRGPIYSGDLDRIEAVPYWCTPGQCGEMLDKDWGLPVATKSEFP